MTLDEFIVAEPVLGAALKGYTHNHVVDGVYQDEGRWVAHVMVLPYYELELCYEARCHPNCQRGPGGSFTWHWEGHRCCDACKEDAGHHYETIHE